MPNSATTSLRAPFLLRDTATPSEPRMRRLGFTRDGPSDRRPSEPTPLPSSEVPLWLSNKTSLALASTLLLLAATAALTSRRTGRNKPSTTNIGSPCVTTRGTNSKATPTTTGDGMNLPMVTVVGHDAMFVHDLSLDGDEGFEVGRRKVPVQLDDGYVLLTRITARLNGFWFMACDECG